MNRVSVTAILLSVALGVSAGGRAGASCGPEKWPADSLRGDGSLMMRDVTVHGTDLRAFRMKTSANNILVDKAYMDTHFGGSLMQTLSGLPGVKAMNIGSGQSKPAIRGLGFNRMVVAEDDIKHEGQQWGDDHGLEIDQFAVDRIEIIKGPGALLYGSDAIGGVINLYTNYVPVKPFEGGVSVFTRSNNASLGLSAKVGGRAGKFFYKAHLTAIDYADYKVPADSIQYYSYFIRLKDRTLRNTAGLERDGSVTLGYLGYRFRTDIKVSDSYAKSGFFANAHGLEVRLSDIPYDASRRDIDLPYQRVNHLKVMSHTVYQQEKMVWEADLAYQDNLREERSEPVSHGYMPAPEGSLERRFHKRTLTAKVGMRLDWDARHTLNMGVNGEYQHNRRDGWGFILPDFEAASLGVYAFDRFTVSKSLVVNAGLRYDYGRIHIHRYNDWYKTPVETGSDSVYLERSADRRRSFSSLTWSVGVDYAAGPWLLKANVGKSFRMPIAKELGTDGVNYHIFRYEKGNPALAPEESYQADLGIYWKHREWSIQVEPYLNYFPNYIYMNPTSDFYNGLQMYYYTQSRVFRYGFEAQVIYRPAARWELSVAGEYLHARQLSGEKEGYSLPFTPPVSVTAGARYVFVPAQKGEGFVSMHLHAVGRQDDTVPPEKPTAGYYTLGLTAGKEFRMGGCRLTVRLNAENLLNRRYYDHTSFYRLIDVPEPGRNVAMMVGLNF